MITPVLCWLTVRLEIAISSHSGAQKYTSSVFVLGNDVNSHGAVLEDATGERESKGKGLSCEPASLHRVKP